MMTVTSEPSGYYKVDCNGVEIARGPWSEIADCLQAHVAQAMANRTGEPLGFNIRIGRAHSQLPPQRTKTAGQARELQIEDEIARMADDGNRFGRR